MSSIKFTNVLLLLAACVVSACHDKEKEANVAVEENCSFRTGNLDKLHCRVSVYRLLANPQAYLGKHVYTFGYLRVEGGVPVVLAPTPYTFESNDTIGCITIRGVKAIRIARQAGMSADGVYAVSLGGLLLKPKEDICSASLSNVVVTSARGIEVK